MANGYGMPAMDFSVLGNLGQTYTDSRKDAVQERTLAELGRMLQGGQVDYNQLAGTLAQLGQITPALSALQAGRQHEAVSGLGPLLGDVLGGSSGGVPAGPPVARPAPPPSRGVPSPTPAAALGPMPAADDPTMTVSPRQVALANAPAAGPSPNGPGTAAPTFGAPVSPQSPAETVGQRFPEQAGQPFRGQVPGAAPAAAPAFSPQALRVIQAMSNPDLPAGARQSLLAVLPRLMPADNKIMALPDGTILSVNERTGAAVPIYQGARPQFTKIGTTNGEDQYGFVDPTRQTVTPAPGSDAQPNNPYSHGKQTGDQSTSGLYATRMFQAEKVLRDPNVVAAATDLIQRGMTQIPVAGNYLRSEAFQKFDQAQRNFINATLRRESGAVISTDEFNNARQQYFPQPGDSAQTIQQKLRNRADAIRGIAGAAGPGYKPPMLFDTGGDLVPNPRAGDRNAPPAQEQPLEPPPVQARPDTPVRVRSPAEAAKLPKGTRFIDPNGVERIVP